jgi:serine/threonine protein phosphatase PrpC
MNDFLSHAVRPGVLMAWQPLSPSRIHHVAFGTAFGMTDVGLVRTSNEDNFLIDEPLNLVMVADGMGGHEAGEVASASALSAVRQYLRDKAPLLREPHQQLGRTHAQTSISAELSTHDPDATWADETAPAVGMVFDAVEFANDQLYAQNVVRDAGDGRGMGTTLTGVWQVGPDGPIIFFQVGDSRLYLLRHGALTQLSRDQTLYQQAIEDGRIEDLPARNMLLQAVGPSSPIKPEIKTCLTQPGDLLMLCSDGLHGSVAHAEIESLIASTPSTGLEEACRRLIARALSDGGKDNITVVMIELA